MAHAIDYVELAVDDLGQAKAFYAKALGWTFTDYGDDYAGIQDPTRPGHEFGGLNPHAASSRGEGVLALARSDDADAALASVLAAGGRIVVELHGYPGGGGSCSPTPGATCSGSTSPASRRSRLRSGNLRRPSPTMTGTIGTPLGRAGRKSGTLSARRMHIGVARRS